jgi:hypothetical protein
MIWREVSWMTRVLQACLGLQRFSDCHMSGVCNLCGMSIHGHVDRWTPAVWREIRYRVSLSTVRY